MGIKEVITAPRSSWQNPFVERVIGSIRRNCLDHVIVLNEAHLRRILQSYSRYYHETRTHLSLEKDTPEPRPIQSPTESPLGNSHALDKLVISRHMLAKNIIATELSIIDS
ncbi:MAG: transposase [Alphaproteobacteria bacterium]